MRLLFFSNFRMHFHHRTMEWAASASVFMSLSDGFRIDLFMMQRSECSKRKQQQQQQRNTIFVTFLRRFVWCARDIRPKKNETKWRKIMCMDFCGFRWCRCCWPIEVAFDCSRARAAHSFPSFLVWLFFGDQLKIHFRFFCWLKIDQCDGDCRFETHLCAARWAAPFACPPQMIEHSDVSLTFYQIYDVLLISWYWVARSGHQQSPREESISPGIPLSTWLTTTDDIN